MTSRSTIWDGNNKRMEVLGVIRNALEVPPIVQGLHGDIRSNRNAEWYFSNPDPRHDDDSNRTYYINYVKAVMRVSDDTPGWRDDLIRTTRNFRHLLTYEFGEDILDEDDSPIWDGNDKKQQALAIIRGVLIPSNS